METYERIRAFQDAVCAPAYGNLTLSQREFVCTMLEDQPDPTRVSDLEARTGKSKSWVGKHRSSLPDAQVLSAPQYGYVEYAVSQFGDYLKRIDSD